MIGRTRAERPYLLESRHWRQTASPLVLGAKQVDRLHRQPEMQGTIRTTMFLGIAFTEALALFGFVLFFLAKS